MFWLFAVTAVLVVSYLGWWARTRRETIRVYRDRIESACEETEPSVD
jgi:hypothetical protein